MLYNIVLFMGVGRVLIGLATFVAIGTASRLLGIPAAHDTPTTRLMARLFGTRDIGLGVLAFYGLAHPDLLPLVALFNGLTDSADRASCVGSFAASGIEPRVRLR